MGAPKTGNVRNVVLVGQGGVGKTSLAEAMLHLSGKTARLGGHGGTKPTLDYDARRSSASSQSRPPLRRSTGRTPASTCSTPRATPTSSATPMRR